MSSPSSLPGPDEVLRYVEQQLDKTEAALRDNQPDQLSVEAEALGRGIALFQQVFQQELRLLLKSQHHSLLLKLLHQQNLNLSSLKSLGIKS